MQVLSTPSMLADPSARVLLPLLPLLLLHPCAISLLLQPCGGAIPLCMVQEFDLPQEIIDRKVRVTPGPHTLHALARTVLLYMLLPYAVLSHVMEVDVQVWDVDRSLFAGHLSTLLLQSAPACHRDGSQDHTCLTPAAYLHAVRRELDCFPRCTDSITKPICVCSCAQVTKMKMISPSNREVDVGKTLSETEYIGMCRREVMDAYLRDRAEKLGATVINGLMMRMEQPGGCIKSLACNLAVRPGMFAMESAVESKITV